MKDRFDSMTPEEQLLEETLATMMQDRELSEDEAMAILEQRQGELFGVQ